jgi:hypothetical protein
MIDEYSGANGNRQSLQRQSAQMGAAEEVKQNGGTYPTEAHSLVYDAEYDDGEVVLPQTVPMLSLEQLERGWTQVFPADRRSSYQEKCFLRDESSAVPQVRSCCVLPTRPLSSPA